MSPENFDTIGPSLVLQGEITVHLQQLGFGNRAQDIACEIMDLVLRSDAIKPEIKAIYEAHDDDVETDAGFIPNVHIKF